MSAPSASAAEATELARSLDESLAKILPGALLLSAAEHDAAPGDATQQDLLGLGWTGIAVSEDAGGLGLDEEAIVKLAAVAGRRLLPAALRGEALVLAPALARLAADEPRAADLLGSLLAGEIRGGGAVVEDDGADVTLALAPGATLAAVIGPTSGTVVEVAGAEPVAALDAGQGHARLRPGAAVLKLADVEDIRRRWVLAVLAEAYGAAQRMLELSAEYVTQREQFGRKIVTFQAVSHRVARMAVELESLDAGIGRLVASSPWDEGLEAVLRHAVPAHCRTVCESAIQVHGGMGFTWEYGLHLYYRRVLDLQALLGGAGTTLRRAGAHYLATRA